MLSRMPVNPSQAQAIERLASLFSSGRSLAARVPREFEGTELLIRKDGGRLMYEPDRKNRLRNRLASWDPLADDLPEVEDAPRQPRDEL